MAGRIISFNWSLSLDDPIESMIHSILVDIDNPRERREFIINAILYYSKSPYLELIGGLKDLVTSVMDKINKPVGLDKDLYIRLDGMSSKLDSFVEQVLLEVRDSKPDTNIQEDDRLFSRLNKISQQIDNLSLKVSEQVVVREVVNNSVVDKGSADIVIDDVESDGLDKLFTGMGDKFGVTGD
jgi:hypothetical protein